MNKATLIGRVGKDPEIRTTNSGAKVASFSLATTERYKVQGEKKEATEWHNIVAWSNMAEIIESYVKKGDHLMIEGRIVTRNYDDKDGNKRYVTEIIANSMEMLGGKKPDQSQPIDKEQIQDDVPGDSDNMPF